MGTTRIRRVIPAPRADVYAALIDPDAIAKWRFPEGMSIRIHGFEAREGGSFRVSLAYGTAAPSLQGAMTITTTLADAEGGTLLTAIHAGLPPGLSEADNEAGWKESLEKLAAYLGKP